MLCMEQKLAKPKPWTLYTINLVATIEDNAFKKLFKVLATVKNSVVNAVFPIWPIVEFPIHVSQVLNRVSKCKNG